MDSPVILPKDNITGKESIDRDLLESADWAAAKSQADVGAAERIIARLWNPKKTDALKSPDGQCDEYRAGFTAEHVKNECPGVGICKAPCSRDRR